MKRRIPALIAAFLVLPALLLAGCSVTPRHEFDPQADFTRFQSYTWKLPEYGNGEVSDPILDSPLLGKRVEAAVDSVLLGRGYVRDDEKADFIVTYHTSKDIELRDTGPRFSVGVYRGWTSVHTGVLWDTWPRVSKEGVLIIDIVDADNGSLVWRGWRDMPLSQSSFDAERVRDSVANILSAFPPEPGAR